MKVTKIALITVSVVYGACIICLALAQMFYQDSFARERVSAGEALGAVRRACMLNPFRSRYYYRQYYLVEQMIMRGEAAGHSRELLRDGLEALGQAIDREPAEALYHIRYGLALLKIPTTVRDRQTAAEVESQLLQAVELKPQSVLYKKIYNDYRAQRQARQRRSYGR